jgi:hypothetical protein
MITLPDLLAALDKHPPRKTTAGDLHSVACLLRKGLDPNAPAFPAELQAIAREAAQYSADEWRAFLDMTRSIRSAKRTDPIECSECRAPFLPEYRQQSRCPPCEASHHHRMRGNHFDALAERPVEAHPRNALPYALDWIGRASLRMGAAAEWAEAARTAPPRERRRLFRIAINRARWVLSALQQLEALYSDATLEAGGLEVVEGEGEQILEAACAPPPPKLSLVRGGQQ